MKTVARAPNRLAEQATEQPAERHRAPDQEAHRRVHPAEQPLRRQALPEAHLGHVVDDDADAAPS